MLTKIRSGVFETNSSSVHSLVWHNSSKWDEPIAKIAHFTVFPHYYGRMPSAPLTTRQERLSYLWTAILENACEYKEAIDENGDCHYVEYIDWDFITKWTDTLKEYLPHVTFFIPDKMNIENNWDYDIGIDHVGLLDNLLAGFEEDKQALQDFIYDANGYILISGDEYEDEDKPFDSLLARSIDWADYEKLIKLQDTSNNYRNYVYIKGN
jgi:hypothetical protein